MNKQLHHIQKQQLVMEFSSEEKSIEWNKNASAFYFDKLLPLLDDIFTRHFPEKQVFYLDKLELDLGTIEEKFLYENLLKKLESELKLILNRIQINKKDSFENFSTKRQGDIDENGRTENGIIVKGKKEHALFCFCFFLDHGVFPWNSNFMNLHMLETAISKEIGYERLIANKEFQVRLKKETSIRRLHFQFSGRFWAKICKIFYATELPPLYNLRDELLKELLPLAKDIKSKKEIKSLLAADILDWVGIAAPADTKEWPRQYILWAVKKVSPFVMSIGETIAYDFFARELQRYKSSQQYTILFKNMVVSYKNEITSIRLLSKEKARKAHNSNKGSDSQHDKGSIPPPGSTSHKTGKSASTIVSKGDSKSFENFENSSIRETQNPANKKNESIKRKDNVFQSSEVKPKKKGRSSGGSIETQKIDKNEFFSGSESKVSSKPNEISNLRGEEETSEINLPDQNIQNTSNEAADFKKKDLINKDVSPTETAFPDEYYIQQAGIILVWPYLKSLFNYLEYLDDKAFKDIKFQQRAVHVLNFIATGHEQCEEHTLIIAKFLCGWPLQMPLIKKIALTEKEKSESEQMIQHLIGNWPVLKKTSVEGVRSSFFIREGKLFKEEENWRLLVAQKSYDMLLDHLPYTLSIIKLPWMQEMLKVDWA